MPNVEEAGQQRETFGESAGWSDHQRTEAPITPAAEGAPGASPTPDAAAAPSAAPQDAQEQTSEQGTPPSTQPVAEPKWNLPPKERWEEVLRERDEARKLAQMALEKLQAPQAAPAPAVPAEDPWKGRVDHVDPATAQFWQEQQRLFRYEAQRIAQEQGQGILKAVDAGRQELAAIKVAQFRKENPEIKPDSPEERHIASLVQQGFDLESAKKLTLYDRLDAENRALKSRQATVPQKRAAAQVEASSGIPATAGLPAKPGDWREHAGAIIDQGGDFHDVLKAVFGGKRA